MPTRSAHPAQADSASVSRSVGIADIPEILAAHVRDEQLCFGDDVDDAIDLGFEIDAGGGDVLTPGLRDLARADAQPQRGGRRLVGTVDPHWLADQALTRGKLGATPVEAAAEVELKGAIHRLRFTQTQ